MILEDERLLCWVLAENLVDMACSIVCVENAEEAFRFIEKIKFHLMILDYGLPGMTGLDLLSILRKRGITLPVIMMTAANDPEIEERATGLDIVHFFRKPFGSYMLKKIVQTYFATSCRDRSIGRHRP
ncbi:MAG: response regulator [Deltaproteobacteria bacterium]|nr:response regulator [Deltaproteobacteria bacterium]